MNKKNFSLRDCFLGVGILFLGIGSQLNAQNIKAVDDNILIGVNQPKSFEPLINDNKNVLNLDVKIISSPKFGSANISNSTFEISYSPNTSFQGRDTLTYEICDLDNVEPCSQAKVLFKVGKVALNPTANNDADSTGENKLITIDVLKNDIVTTVGAMKVQIDVNPKFGSAVVIANKIQYTPNLNFSGHDTLYYALVDTFTFQQGGRVDSMDVGRLAIYVNDLHSQGNEIGDTIFLPQVSIRTKNVLINNIDTENDKLFVSGYGSKLTNNNDSTFTYKPASGFTGIDILTYQVCSDLSNNIAKRQCVTDSVIIVVMPASINKAPVLTVNPVRDSIYFGQTGSVQLFATDNQDLIIKSIFGLDYVSIIPSNIPNDLSFTYTTNATRTKHDTVTVQICETVATSSCVSATVILTLIDNTPKPIAVNDSKKLKEDATVAVEVLNNDVINGSKITSVTFPTHGSLDTTGNVFKYTPNTGYYGKDYVTYTLCRDSCSTATLTLEIEPVYKPIVIEGVSPDGDGINDAFGIEDVDYSLLDVSVKIFNRWGTVIYSEAKYNANDSSKNWSGQSNNGEEVVDGTYFYIVEIPQIDFKQSGYLAYIGSK